MSQLRYLCLFVHSGVQHILCCVFLRLVVPYVVSVSGMSILVFSNVYLVIKNIIRSIIIIIFLLYQLLQVDKKKGENKLFVHSYILQRCKMRTKS